MTTIDIIIAIPLLWGLFKGFRKGFIVEISSLLALVLGVYGAVTFGDMGGEYLESQFNTDPHISRILGFALLFLVIVAAVFLLGKAVEKLVNMVALGLVNKLFGMLFGGLKWALIVGALLYVVNGIPLTSGMISEQSKEESLLYGPMMQLLPAVYPVLSDPRWREGLKEGLDKVKEQVPVNHE